MSRDFDDLQRFFHLVVAQGGCAKQGCSSHNQGLWLEQALGRPFLKDKSGDVLLAIPLAFCFAASFVEHDGEVR